MLSKLIALKKIIDEDPKAPMFWWSKETGLNNKEINYLRDNNFLNKLGDRKGTTWVWKGDEPDYEFAESMKVNIYALETKEDMRVNNVEVTDNTTMLDVISAYNLSFKISNGITLKFINNSTVSLRKSNGKTITISDANKLNDMLCFLT
tara:strand:- start:5530 stop:5976 length:447 start_codon:yes stop_codon:yes gene_type:complete